MPAVRVIKQRPVETTSRMLSVTTKPVEAKPSPQLQVPSTRKPRASSCPKRIHSNRCESMKTQSNLGATKCERRGRSTSSAPKSAVTCPKATVTCPKSTGKTSAVISKSEEATNQKDQRPKAHSAIQSHKAFTVIPPNPKKRKEIQKQAEEELAALEDLRLSRAMAYISINPSSVGGCLSLEEVRLKQQQEMQARRRQRQMKRYMLEPLLLGMRTETQLRETS